MVNCRKTYSGKTHCLRSMMLDYGRKKHFKFGYIYTQNLMNDDLNFCPKKCIAEYTEEHCAQYIEKLSKYREDTKGKTTKLPPSFLIFEDCIGSANMNLYSPTISKLIILHRHLNISIFLLSQYLGGKNGSSTLMRECVNYAILFNSRFKNSKEFLYQTCGGLFKKEQDFVDILEEATSVKHRALFYDSSKNTIDDAYMCYTAPKEIPPFEIKF